MTHNYRSYTHYNGTKDEQTRLCSSPHPGLPLLFMMSSEALVALL